MSLLKHLTISAVASLWLVTCYVAAEDSVQSQTTVDAAASDTATATSDQLKDAKDATDGATSETTATTDQAKPAEDLFPPDQIEQLVAPIALYPDALIAQILMASTYPLDVVQADRWTGDHKDIEGEALEKAADEEAWDPSIKSLVFFPGVLKFMSDNLDWTQDLGDAVLSQQDEVTDAIQKLRREATAAGNLETTEQQRVETEGDTIIIQPAQPEVVYVPSYTPAKVYGQSAPPATTYYPTTYTQPATTYVAPVAKADYDPLIAFGTGALVGGLLTAAIMWNNHGNDRIYYGGRGHYGGSGYWNRPNYWRSGGRNVNINRNVQRGDITVNKGIVGNDIRAGKWQHNPVNRGGVRYRNTDSTRNFANVHKERNIDRDVARGRDPNRKRPQLGDRDRPGKGDAPRLNPAERKRADKLRGSDAKPGDRQRPGRGDGARAKLDGRQRPAGGDGKRPVKGAGKDRKRPAGKVAAKPKTKPAQRPKGSKAAPKKQPRAAAKQPKTRNVKISPKTRQAALKRPAKRATQRATPKASRHSGGRSSTFKANKGARRASNRGTRSRGSGHRGGGHRGGGGRGRR